MKPPLHARLPVVCLLLAIPLLIDLALSPLLAAIGGRFQISRVMLLSYAVLLPVYLIYRVIAHAVIRFYNKMLHQKY